MCTNTQTSPEGHQFACRTCNQCIAARKNTWVARAMAEQATAGHSLLVTLTYRRAPDGSDPAGATHFRYAHVSTFLKRLRESYKRKYQARSEISFICAGERGSKRDRVHWHLVLFAKRDLLALGDWSDYQGRSLPGPRIGQRNALDSWSLWEHGSVDVMHPDQAGMAYVLKYALKDAFNLVKSRGTSRAMNAEIHGASYFRMSKNPPIGARHLEAVLDDWERRRVVPVAAQVPVPGYSGYWYPTGKMREQFLVRLHHINQLRRSETGRDCAGWSSLVAAASVVETDLETLLYGEEIEEVGETLREFEDRIGSPRARIRQRCGGVETCRLCRRGQTEEGAAARRAWQADQARQFVTDTAAPEGLSLDRWFRRQGGINPFCALADAGHREAFAA